MLQNCIPVSIGGVPITVSRNVSSPQLAAAPSQNIVTTSSAGTTMLLANSPKNGTKAHQAFRTATIPGAAVRNLIQTGTTGQSLQFLSKIQNKTSVILLMLFCLILLDTNWHCWVSNPRPLD
uniref:Uncharacterized protein n=1 Tax=Cacopsylla melanoneura TaxID=428564 RepID=A0A8D9DXV0_9HEMI